MTSETSANSTTCASAKALDRCDHLRELEHRTADFLLQKYGPVLDGKALLEVLRYPTFSALERSLQRGHLKIKTIGLPGRRGIFVHSLELARFLASMSAESEDDRRNFQPEDARARQVEKGA